MEEDELSCGVVGWRSIKGKHKTWLFDELKGKHLLYLFEIRLYSLHTGE